MTFTVGFGFMWIELLDFFWTAESQIIGVASRSRFAPALFNIFFWAAYQKNMLCKSPWFLRKCFFTDAACVSLVKSLRFWSAVWLFLWCFLVSMFSLAFFLWVPASFGLHFRPNSRAQTQSKIETTRASQHQETKAQRRPIGILAREW